MTERRMVHYTTDTLPEGRFDRERVDSMTDKEILAIALSDPDNPPATDQELAQARAVRPEDRAGS